MAVKKPSYTSGVSSVGIDFGKIPPQALDLEEAVLGAVMLEKDAILQIIDLLRPESFYKEEHQKIFQAIIDLTSGNRAIDLCEPHMGCGVCGPDRTGETVRAIEDRRISRRLDLDPVSGRPRCWERDRLTV